MTVSITIRAVPNHVRDELAARAARSGRSLQEYLVSELGEIAARPNLDDALREVRLRAMGFPPTSLDEILTDRDADRV